MFHIQWLHIVVVAGVITLLLVGAILLFLFAGFVAALFRSTPAKSDKEASNRSTANAGYEEKSAREELATLVVQKLRASAAVSGSLPSHPAVDAVVDLARRGDEQFAALVQIRTAASKATDDAKASAPP